MRDLPKSMIIVGGGVIGVEYASMLAAVGVHVTLRLNRDPKLLEFVDDELIESLQFRLRDMGMRLRLGESVSQIQIVGNHVEAELASKKILRADMLMYSIGRQGATDKLNLAAAGLAADNRGRLKVNEYYQTVLPAHLRGGGCDRLSRTGRDGHGAGANGLVPHVPPGARRRRIDALPVRHLHDSRNQHGRPDRAGASRKRVFPTTSASPAIARPPADSSSAIRMVC